MHGRGALDGFPAELIAEAAGVHVSTARRWKRGEPLSEPVRRLLAVMLNGELGAIDPAWKGWSVRAGTIAGPDGWCFQPGEIMAIPFLRMQLNSYQQRQRVALQADFVDERYVSPDENLAPAKRA